MNSPKVGFALLSQKRVLSTQNVTEQPIVRFNRTVQLLPAASNVAVNILSDNSGTANAPFPSGTDPRMVDVPTGYQAIIEGMNISVNGGTLWAGGTGTFVQIEDTAGTLIGLKATTAALAANAFLIPNSANTTQGAVMTSAGGRCTLSKGLQVKSDNVYATGSTLQVTVWGYIEKIV